MKNNAFRFGLKFALSVLAVAFAAQITVTLTDLRFGDSIRQVAPVFGISIAIVLAGGYRYLPAIFIGALLSSAFEEQTYLLVLSMPFSVTLAAACAYGMILRLKVAIQMERIRDALLIILCGFVLSTLIGAVVQTLYICSGNALVYWNQFLPLLMLNWLSASVGAIIVAPFILTWATPGGFRLPARQGLEVVVWFSTLLLFGHVTFQNWAPNDTLFYPMELAIFPIMAWASIRFGLRGATAGVLALALLAGWEIIKVYSGAGGSMSQSPANVWIFVGIVSVTSICLAAVMTELRVREAKVFENESRLRAFTDALPDIAFVFSQDGHIHDIFAATSWIRSNHRIVSSERAVGRNIKDIFELKVCREFLKIIERAILENRVQKHEYSLESVDVGKHTFEARVTPMQSSLGVPAQVVWVAYDISDRKLAEEAIAGRDQILQATARANNNLLTTKSFEKAVEAAMREVVQALRVERAFVFEITDRTQEALQSLHIRHEWCANDHCRRFVNDSQYHDAPMEECCPRWHAILCRGGYVRIDGDSIGESDSDVLKYFNSCAMLIMPMWVEGELYGFFGVDHCSGAHTWGDSEISAVRVLSSSLSGLILMKRREEELRLAKDMADAANSTKGEFLAVMSHEIRTPMNAIIGYTDLLWQTNLSEVQAEHAVIIKRSGRALMELINNILDYSKIESRSIDLEAAEFDLEQIVCESLENILVLAKEKSIHVDYEIAPDVQEYYIGDAHWLRQVMLNLTNNAVKFTDGGEIVMEVDVECSNVAGYDRLHVVVSDTGCGIAPDKYDRLFQAFSQVDSSTTRKYGGTGLGLIISKRLIERMDGNIWVESEVGQGSRFHFTIQLRRTDQESTRSLVSSQDRADDSLDVAFATQYPMRVLLCEDDQDNRWVIRELLEMLGYRPYVVDCGEDALVQLKHRAYDTVLMDVRLPGISGLELTKLIRSGQEKVESPQQHIIAVTAYAMNEDREKCLGAGMNDYIRKPVEIIALKESLIRAYHERSLNSPLKKS